VHPFPFRRVATLIPDSLLRRPVVAIERVAELEQIR
jgi:hypothetical protein